MKYKNLERLIEIFEILRGENGCVWDRAQTHETLVPNMLEEAYEAVEAIKEGNPEHLREELGDVLLQVVLHSQIAKDNNEFDIEDVAKELNEKLIHRHPHVFGDASVSSKEDVLEKWDQLKKEEKKERKSQMDGIPITLPALMACQKISKRAIKVGFEWDKVETLMECVNSEFDEFIEEVKNNDKDAMDLYGESMKDLWKSTVSGLEKDARISRDRAKAFLAKETAVQNLDLSTISKSDIVKTGRTAFNKSISESVEER